MLRKLLLFYFYLFFSELIFGDTVQYGLTFFSHSVNQDLRTSLNLTPEEPLSFPEGFSIEFLIKFNPGIQAYGYVCRIISDDMQTFDVISNINAHKLNCVLIDDDKALSNVDYKIESSSERKDWNKIKIQFKSNQINCSLNEEVKSMPYSFTDFKKIDIGFGKNFSKMYYSSDAPPISIKDIIIRNEKGKVVYSWELYKYAGDKIYDSVRSKIAIVKNPSWDIDKYIKWEKKISFFISQEYPQTAFDSISKTFYIATVDSLFTLNIKTKTVERIKTNNGSPYAEGTTSQLIYDSKKKRLVSYSLLYPNVIVYNFERNEWSSNKLDHRFAPAHQHNRYIDLENNRLVTFGGYGYQTYKAWLSFRNLDIEGWDKHDLSSQVSPRYLSALGYWGEGKFLILGGYGSISGKQEESPKNFYDLYEIDSRRLTSRKLFDLEVPVKPMVFSNSMIINKNKRKIYALAFNNNRFQTYLRLCEVSLTDGNVELFMDSIPYNFLDMESFCDLILDEEESVLYAVLIQKVANGNEMDIYSLSYPPVKASDVIQTEEVNPTNKQRTIIVLIILFFSLGLLLLFWLFFFRRRKKIIPNQIDMTSLNGDKEYIDVPMHNSIKTASTIKLLGGFQVFDKEGNDITCKFTPILRQIFLLLILHTIKDGKKITSEILDETFWFEMDKTNAANNRSVNIRKLRVLLEQVGDIHILNEGSYWYVTLEDSVKCDYKKVVGLLNELEAKKNFDINTLDAILDVAAKGVLLPDINIGWVDDYKSQYSTRLIDFLYKVFYYPEITSNLRTQIKIANVILLHDVIDEKAIRFKSRALFLSGQKGASKQCFDKFEQDYFDLLNTAPPFTYQDVIKKQ